MISAWQEHPMKSASHNANQANRGSTEAGSSAGISQIARLWLVQISGAKNFRQSFSVAMQNPKILRVFNGHRNFDNVNLLLLVAP